MTVPLSIAALLSGVLLGACSTFGIRSGTEQPTYTVVDSVAARDGNTVEIRRYPPRLAAEVTVAGEEEDARSAGFRRLAAYIFGENRAQAKIAMTAPVAQEPPPRPAGEAIAMTAPVAQAKDRQGQWTIRFFMPADYGRDTLPEPLDAGIAVVELPEETMAVLRYSGARDTDAVDAAARALQRALDGGTWVPAGPPVAYFYDPPWTLPFLRRNEAAVPVRRQE